ncbi:MAG TPA: cobalt ABC transporter substrate-binding protein [Polyangia bacterium]
MKRHLGFASITGASVLGVAVLTAAPAHAHQVWLEQDGKGARLYFGEFGENLRESSPGLLDKFAQPTAVVIAPQAERAATVTKEANGFALSGRAGKGESIVAEDPLYPIIERSGTRAGRGEEPGAMAAGLVKASATTPPPKKTRMAWTPAARYIEDFSAQTPRLTLDVVPTGKPGALLVTFRGQPLPKAKVNVVAASGWERSLETDEQGRLEVALPWKSRYLVAVRHEEAKPGTRKGKAGDEPYDTAAFATTLSFVSRTGLVAPPAPPAAAPNK